MKEGTAMLDYCKKYLPKYTLDLSLNYFHNAKGEYYYAQKNPEEALSHFRQAYQFGLAWKDPYYNADDAWEIGRTFLMLHKTDSAEKYLQLALDTAKKHLYLPKIRFILNDWCKYYSDIGNFEKAYALRTDLMYFTDSLINLQNHKRILLFEARYNSQKNELLIQQLEKDKRIQQFVIRQKDALNYVLIGSSAIFLIIVVLGYRNYQQKQKLQQQRISELETQQQLTATEAVLKGEEQERTRLAKDLHDGLGGMLSGIKYSFNTMKGNLIMTPENAQAFERSMDMLDSSIKEMRRVAHNMMPEALVKFGLDTALKDFCNDINQTGALKVNYQSIGLANITIAQTTAITIYRIVQELINNTMKHAAATSAIVQLSQTDGIISITVEDDGKGFDTAVLNQSKGIGWSNIQNRIEFLKGTIDVKAEAAKGTSVHIEINI
jgi:signal transduction histidine kinase